MNGLSRQSEAAVQIAALCQLRGLGPKSAGMLVAAGIRSAGELRRLGAAAAFLRVREAGQTPSLNLLWALEGALTDSAWTAVAKRERTRLLLELEDLRCGRGEVARIVRRG